jgi:hypothetical protein
MFPADLAGGAGHLPTNALEALTELDAAAGKASYVAVTRGGGRVNAVEDERGGGVARGTW